MFLQLPFKNEHEIYSQEYLIATYLLSDASSKNILRKVGNFAIGQSIGTWLDVPGITQEMREKWQANVLSVQEIKQENTSSFILRIAFPMCNFCNNFAMMFTALVGNDVSTSLNIKLMDIDFTESALKQFTGPRKGVQGLRDLLQITDRPLVLNMIKPCIGITPAEGSALFYQSAISGIDMIKDDEVLSNTMNSSLEHRLEVYLNTAKKAEQETGKRVLYIPNITDTPKNMHKHAKTAIRLGARAVMINFVTTGLDALQEISQEFGDQLWIFGHYAGSGMITGIVDPVLLGILPRLAGADGIMTMLPSIDDDTNFIQTVQKQQMSLGHIKPTMTAIGGGFTPRNVQHTVDILGNDVIMGVGGAIQGHPMGTVAGGKAMLAAIEASMSDISIETMAQKNPELQAALDAWK